jgi:hypothetical protein
VTGVGGSLQGTAGTKMAGAGISKSAFPGDAAPAPGLRVP